MSEKIYDVSPEWAKRAFVDQAKYRDMYARSISDPKGFWAEQAKRIDWIKPFTKVENTSYRAGQYFDQMVRGRRPQRRRQLHRPASGQARRPDRDHLGRRQPLRVASTSPIGSCTTKSAGSPMCCAPAASRKGDRVTIYLPMIPEAAYAMLACARIGAIHSVVFGGFSPDSLAERITDCESKIVITADEGLRGGKKVPLKANVDAAIAKAAGVDWVIVVKRTGGTGQHGSGARLLVSRRRRNGDDGLPGAST